MDHGGGTDCAACLGVDPVGKTSGDSPVTINRGRGRRPYPGNPGNSGNSGNPAAQLPRPPALSAAREAAPIGLRTAVLRFRFGRIEVTTPFVEFVPEGVDALSMIRRAETFMFAHLHRS